jgi:cell division protein FtsQ
MRLVQRNRRVTRRKGRTYAQSHAASRVAVRPTARRGLLPAEKWISLALLGLVVAAAVFFSSSPSFFVYSDEVEYVGLSLLSPEAVWAGTKIPDGLSVFFLHPSQAAAALRKLPEVKNASVALQIPNRLRIVITEREPKIAWTQGGATWWVDDTGKVLAMINPADVPSTSPKATSMDTTPLQSGGQIDELAIRSIMHYNALEPEAVRYRYETEKGISLITSEGWLVHLGDDSDCARKLSLLKVMLNDFSQRGIQPVYLDLRVPDAPAYKR